MKQLPSPTVYAKEIKYMPWGKLMRKVLAYTVTHAPSDGRIVDLMCGPGQLLGQIHKRRSDLHLTGIDIDPRYIRHAQEKYPFMRFVQSDSMTWKAPNTFDLVLCTGGLHHLPYAQHQRFMAKLSQLVSPDGVCVVADPYIDPYQNEKQRRLAAARLGYEYVRAVLMKDATNDIVSATIDILHNDVLPHGEYKTSIRRITQIAKKHFRSVAVYKTWPAQKTSYGDYYLILRT